MCGITAYLGSKSAFLYILDGLKLLQNRGYDSAGVCTINKDGFRLDKFASIEKVPAIKKLESYQSYHQNGCIGIGHTRWATHGAKTDENSHPHLDYTGTIALVHNGIIENYSYWKKYLIEKGIPFTSETDTEVIVNLISYYRHQKKKEMMDAITMTLSKLEGTWGIAVLDREDKNKLYVARNGSPLLIGFRGKEHVMVASEKSGFSNYIDYYICLKNGAVTVLEKNKDGISFQEKDDYTKELLDSGEIELDCKPYPYWTLKEIMEQPDTSQRAINIGGRILDKSRVKLGGLINEKKRLLLIDNLIILGCGTSYHAGLVGMKFFKELECFNTVQIIDGAEFEPDDIPLFGTTSLLLLSQSGETKDLHRCISIGRDIGLSILSIVNVVDSMIAREVDCGVYLNAGREVGVASTKSFTSQIIVLALMSIWFAQHRDKKERLRESFVSDILSLSNKIKYILDTKREICKKVAEKIGYSHSCFILGKGEGEAVAKEGALKMKEIAYIHAEGYSGSALKHGPFALLEEGTPVIMIFLDDKYLVKMKSAAEEIRSRGAYIVGIGSVELEDVVDCQIRIPENKKMGSVLSIIPLQLIAYELSILKGIDPDFPRNLAKVVTVE